MKGWSALILSFSSLAWATVALADANLEMNRILEANASSAAFARMCDEEPLSEQLKSTTMMLLAVNGIEAQNIQLGSAKFNDVMRREVASVKSARNMDCPGRMKEARERLAATRGIIENARRDAPPKN